MTDREELERTVRQENVKGFTATFDDAGEIDPEIFQEISHGTKDSNAEKEKALLTADGRVVKETNEERDPLAWEEISTKHIIRNEWIDFRESAYRFPDGSTYEPYYSYSRRDYVVIAASDENGDYICVRQFRQGIRKVTTEFPAGGIERKDGREYGRRDAATTEGALEAAKRELSEETGYVSDEWRHLLTIPSNATIADNYAYLFEAKNCRKVSGQMLDETEFLSVETHSPDELEKLVKDGDFAQAVHVLAWMLVK